MVGHTGVYEAIEKAVKAVDKCVSEVVEAAKANGLYVIGVLYGDGDPEQVRRAGPDAVASTPEALLEQIMKG